MPSSSVKYLLLSVTILMGALPVVAETRDPGPFYGFWETQEPAGDTCVFNVKRGNRISSFYTGSASSAITQGRWELREDRLVAVWDSGHRDVFSMLGSGALQREAYRPGQELASNPAYTTRAVKIDPRIPGSLGVQRDDATWEERGATASSTRNRTQRDLPIRNDFNGYWKVRQGSGGFFGIGSGGSEEFYLHLLRNGSVEVSLRRWDERNTGITGRWTVEGDAAVIEWANGQHDVLSEGADGSYLLQVYPKGYDDGARPAAMMPAIRSSPIEAGQFFNAGDVRLFTMSDIRGFWVPQQPDDASPTYIQIEGWGRASRQPVPEGSTGRGEWRLFTDRVVVTWDDGSKDVIRLGNRGWEQDRFAPGVPSTGTPAETFAVRRVDAGEVNLSNAR